MIGPGQTVGILGGGQLGRMAILAGRPLGLRFHVLDPSPGCTAGKMADRCTTAGYNDIAALDAFARSVDVVTLEFENIEAAALERLEQQRPVRPGRDVLFTAQHRQREKAFLRKAGIPHVPFALATDPESLGAGLHSLGQPAVIKTAAFGYDGKGQRKVEADERVDPARLWEALGAPPAVVIEKWIPFEMELSAICARGVDGRCTVFPVAENLHRNHILRQSLVPARAPDGAQAACERLATRLAEALDVVGLLAVEFFLTADGEVLVNEMAPRPHNSGHYTMDACGVSQFEQFLRMVCGMPPGDPALRTPVVMTNILGDAWQGGEPDWAVLLESSGCHLHLYDKGEPRRGRKMGHFNVTAASVDDARLLADRLFDRLMRRA